MLNDGKSQIFGKKFYKLWNFTFFIYHKKIFIDCIQANNYRRGVLLIILDCIGGAHKSFFGGYLQKNEKIEFRTQFFNIYIVSICKPLHIHSWFCNHHSFSRRSFAFRPNRFTSLRGTLESRIFFLFLSKIIFFIYIFFHHINVILRLTTPITEFKMPYG